MQHFGPRHATQSRCLCLDSQSRLYPKIWGDAGPSFFADIFVPDRGVLRDVGRQHVDAFFGAQINDFNTILSQPIDAAAEIHRLPDHHSPNSELSDEAAAIPARRERCDHNLVAVTSLTLPFSKVVGL